MEISRVILIGKIQGSYAFFPQMFDKLAFFLMQMHNALFFHKLIGHCGLITLARGFGGLSNRHCVI